MDPDSQTVEVHRNTDDGFVQHACAVESGVVESGAVSSALLSGFALALNDLF